VPDPAGCAEATEAAGGASVVGVAGVLVGANAPLAEGVVVATVEAVAVEVEVLEDSGPVEPEVLAAGRLEAVPVLAAAPFTLVDRWTISLPWT
jgi:hypothetical protein